MKVVCCKCQKKYNLEEQIFENKGNANCPILVCPYCGFKHAINFMPFENRIEDLAEVRNLKLAYYPTLGASRIANATREDRSCVDDGDIKAGVAWDISTFRYGAKSFEISEDIKPSQVFFKPDGLKMYVFGYENKTVYQYSLSTAWNPETATYDNKSFTMTQDIYPFGLFFKPDGTEMYVAGQSNDSIFQYSLSTAWDVDTASYNDKSFSVTSQVVSPSGVFFKPDGLKMYVTNAWSSAAGVYQYSLSTAWEISSASYDTKKLDTIAETTSTYNAFFKSDGFKLYVMGYGEDTIYQYSLSTAWGVDTATYDNKSYVVTPQETKPYGLYFKSDGEEMFIVGMDFDKVHQYVIKTAWNKTDDFILATRIYGAKGPYDFAYKLKWRNKTDGGVFADVGASGEITYSADTVLVDGQALPIESKICDAQPGDKPVYVWQDGMENEGDNILPDTDTYSLADEYYTELQWALDCSNALDEKEYEFALFELTNGTMIGTCLATITMAVTIVGGLSMKWNGRTIAKWNGVVINKLNGVD